MHDSNDKAINFRVSNDSRQSSDETDEDDRVRKARQRLTSAINHSKDGREQEARTQVRHAASLLDVELEAIGE